MKLSRHRTIGMMQIIRQKGTVTLEDIMEGFNENNVNVGTGAHLKTLLTPLIHLGLIAKSKSAGYTNYWITPLGDQVLTARVGERDRS